MHKRDLTYTSIVYDCKRIEVHLLTTFSLTSVFTTKHSLLHDLIAYTIPVIIDGVNHDLFTWWNYFLSQNLSTEWMY